MKSSLAQSAIRSQSNATEYSSQHYNNQNSDTQPLTFISADKKLMKQSCSMS
jgi:hypothetical protein